MPRPAAPRSQQLLIAVAFVAVLAALAAAFTSIGGSPEQKATARSPKASDGGAACATRSLRLDAAPEIVPVLQQVLRERGCDRIIVGSVDPARVVHNIVEGTDVPELWVPDSTAWLTLLGKARGEVGESGTATLMAPSLAATPVVVAGTDSSSDSWATLLANPDFLGGDPLSSSVSAAPLLAAAAEQPDARTLAGGLVPLAQRYAGGAGVPALKDRLQAVITKGGLTAATEQAVLQAGDEIKMAAPEKGTAVLDYPLVLTAARHRAEAADAAGWLARAFSGSKADAALVAADFRTPDGAPLPDGRGVGAVTPLQLGDPATAAKAVTGVLQMWARLALPARALAVFDVSGSMGFKAGSETRMDLTKAAARQGVGLFPDTAAIGVWAFSQGLDGDRDYRPVLPVRPLDAQVGSGTQRDALLASLDEVRFIPGTATGLYDTVLAAYREQQSHYDPAYVNSVILFTDGRNEDPGSISLKQLLAKFADLAKPTEPVPVITIGISKDADVSALQKISAATGGTSYVARDPRDIAKVFREALSARVG